jgi:phospholipase/lecithinase/hemolysin
MANLVRRRHANEIDITIFDVNTQVRQIIANPTNYGFSDVTHSFLDTGIVSPDENLFWDLFHPTAKGHQLLAAAAAVAIHDNRKEK